MAKKWIFIPIANVLGWPPLVLVLTDFWNFYTIFVAFLVFNLMCKYDFNVRLLEHFFFIFLDQKLTGLEDPQTPQYFLISGQKSRKKLEEIYFNMAPK